MGRTLLSDAFDLDLDFDFDLVSESSRWTFDLVSVVLTLILNLTSGWLSSLRLKPGSMQKLQ